VVVQEAFGVTAHIREVCDRLAADGYLAVAPAMFHRLAEPAPEVAYDDVPRAIELMRSLLADDVLADVDDALAVVAARGIGARRTAIVGFCTGGTVALHVAAARSLGAAVTFYGGGVAEGRMGFAPMLDAAPTLRTPWLGLFGDLDASIPVDEVDRLRDAASLADVPADVVRYPGAQHGFHCDDRPEVFDAGAAADAWSRALAWFAAHLGRQA
jgi:carboxymethylenebutenolidase